MKFWIEYFSDYCIVEHRYTRILDGLVTLFLGWACGYLIGCLR
jgi:hypothetical protein